MIIHKINDSYIIKLLEVHINVYNPQELEDITKKIIQKITKKNKLQNYIHIEIYLNDNYGTIIKLTDYNSPFTSKKEKTVKITIHTQQTFLYQIDYFNTVNIDTLTANLFYYKNKFYLQLNNTISKDKYLNILELSTIIYEDTDIILDKGIKI